MEFTKMRSLFKIEDIYAKQSQDDSAQNKGIGSIYNVLGQRISIPQSNPLGIGVTASLTPAQTQSIDSLDYVGNFIYEKGQLKRYMFDDGYLKLYTNTFSPRFFIKDHGFEMHNPLNPLNWPRNIETIIGKSVAGNGKPFEINIYGSKKLTPILPWIK